MTGVDVPIESLRTDFQNNLWTSFSNSFYGKTFRNEKDGEVIPEVLVSGNDYKEVRFDDRYDSICFFDVNDIVENLNDQMEVRVMIILAVNLNTIFQSRATEESHRDVWNIIDNHRPTITMQTLHLGLKAYGELSTKGLKAYNMHPWHTFSIETIMLINYLNC